MLIRLAIFITCLAGSMVVRAETVPDIKSINIPSTDIKIHYSKTDFKKPASPGKICAYAVSATVARKYTIEKSFALCSQGKFDDVIERPRAGSEIVLIVKLPGIFDHLTYQPRPLHGRLSLDGTFELRLRLVGVHYASPSGPAEAYALVELPAQKAGKLSVKVEFENWIENLDAKLKVRIEKSTELKTSALAAEFELLP